jgi:hypothetical protein
MPRSHEDLGALSLPRQYLARKPVVGLRSAALD